MPPEKKSSFLRNSSAPPPTAIMEEESWWSVSPEAVLSEEIADVYIKTFNIFNNLPEEICEALPVDPRLIFENRLGGHSLRTPILAGLMYEHLSDEEANLCNLETLIEAAFLHDLGKLRADINELMKQDRQLTKNEWKLMKEHPKEGSATYANLVRIMKDLVVTDENSVHKAIEEHHEREDGNGYYGVEQETLSTETKILTICDSTDAMLAPRTHDPQRNKEEVEAELLRCSGLKWNKALTKKQEPECQFQPNYAKIMVGIINKYHAIFRFR